MGLIFCLPSVQSHITASRRALEAFLARYPLCYGYWKKFADLERRAGYNNKAEEVKHKRAYNSVFCTQLKLILKMLSIFHRFISELMLKAVVCCVRCVFRVSK